MFSQNIFDSTRIDVSDQHSAGLMLTRFRCVQPPHSAAIWFVNGSSGGFRTRDLNDLGLTLWLIGDNSQAYVRTQRH